MTISATHIGTATILLRIGELTILTDPAFDPAGTVYDVGSPIEARRLAGPALDASDLPAIDLVLLSHDEHADNLDHAGRQLLSVAEAVITTTSGAARLGGNAVGLEPWDHHEIGGVRIIATPARHGPEGIEALSGDVIGFLVETPELTIYISGDTVYYGQLDDIGRRFSVDVAFLHLGDAHVEVLGDVSLTMNSDQAVQLARSLDANTVVPVHYDSWAHFAEDPERITEAFTRAGMTNRLLMLTPGIAQRLPPRGAGNR
jgi:L-ascorbate metabolism protein UlaG (beta-lactamase superfamily)